MRKTIIAFLLAAGATPASASQVEQNRDPGTHEAQHQTPVMSERQDGFGGFVTERVSTDQREPRQAPDVHHNAPVVRDEHRGLHREYRQEHRELHRENPSKREHRQFHREVKRDHRQEHQEVHSDTHRGYRADHREIHRSDPTRREHRVFHREVNRDHQTLHREWDRNWRGNQNYDWRSYRSRYGSLYQAPGYYDPFGSAYGYRRYSVGFSLGRQYYSSGYIINDPWRYRLPPATGSYRWVRYYDDVLLVDVFSGRVVDVIYNFFW